MLLDIEVLGGQIWHVLIGNGWGLSLWFLNADLYWPKKLKFRSCLRTLVLIELRLRLFPELSCGPAK